MLNSDDKFFLSFSAIETYKTCQRKYYYNYIAKLPRKHWPWLTFGNFNHLVLEKFYNYILYHKKRQKDYNKKLLMMRAFSSAIRKTYRLAHYGKQVALTQDQIDATKKLLNRYFQKIANNEPDVLFTEKYFELDLGENIWLRGYMDRVDRLSPKQFKITDYKTSKEAYAIDKNEQLAIYAIGLRQVLDEEDVEIYKQLDFLKVGKTVPLDEDGVLHDTSGDQTLLANLQQIGKNIRDKIKTDKLESDWQWKENSFCWCCDFKNACMNSRGTNQNVSNDFEFA